MTFAESRVAAHISPIGVVDPDTGRRFLNGGIRTPFTYPTMAVDTSNGPRRGTLYLVWADGRNADADIMFSHSTDGGQTWSSPVRINDDPMGNGKDQFFPWISVDSTNGNIVVMFYDRRNNSENLIVDVYTTRSTDGGATFEPNFQVNTESFNPMNVGAVFLDPLIGDYNGLVTYGNTAYPVWTDTRQGSQDIFGARVRFGP
ncbi:MAG: exo-alpha-sialidase [Acidobacteria bacterium]|nr:exo-alpha-sialidase [Acidobacteriota bacterium]